MLRYIFGGKTNMKNAGFDCDQKFFFSSVCFKTFFNQRRTVKERKKSEIKRERDMQTNNDYLINQRWFNSSASEVSREVANLTERKNPHPPCIWCQRICLSVCLSVCVTCAFL